MEAGTVRLVGTDRDRIVSEAARLLENPDAYARMSRAVNPYGDGHSASRIVSALVEEASERQTDRKTEPAPVLVERR